MRKEQERMVMEDRKKSEKEEIKDEEDYEEFESKCDWEDRYQ